MPSSPDFVTFVLDLLAPLGPVEARAMFGGHGLYAQGVMFGLLDDDELFLKTDEASRGAFVDAGCRRWVYGRMESTSYFRPPDPAHEDPEAMLPWARLALAAALRTRSTKGRAGGRKEGTRMGAGARRTAKPARAKDRPAAGRPPRRRRRGPAKR